MEEAEGFFIPLSEAVPVGAGRLQEVECADDIRLDEFCGAVDGAVDMGLCGEVHDRARLMLGEKLGNQLGISDITSHENMARIAFQ